MCPQMRVFKGAHRCVCVFNDTHRLVHAEEPTDSSCVQGNPQNCAFLDTHGCVHSLELTGSCVPGNPLMCVCMVTHRCAQAREPTDACIQCDPQICVFKDTPRFANSEEPTGPCKHGNPQTCVSWEPTDVCIKRSAVSSNVQLCGFPGLCGCVGSPDCPNMWVPRLPGRPPGGRGI